jgi:predicted acyltransferase
MKRYLSLDFLRGVSIFGMVFSAIIPYGVLPAWMYHIQNPPPHHKFDMSVSGISWVDLVFPVFIFCMGVATPLAGRRRLDAAAGRDISRSYIGDVLERFLMLWLFSYLYVLLNFSTAPGWWAQLATVIGFISLFPLYLQFSKSTGARTKLYSRIGGALLITALITYGHFRFDEVISLNRSGIIIFLLAFLYLFGALIWYFTRDNLKWRVIVFTAILIFTAVTIPMGLQPKLYAAESIRWFFNMEYIYFLLILIPATYVGDLIYNRLSDEKGYNPAESSSGENRTNILYRTIFVYILWLMFALYRGHYFANIVVTLLFTGLIYFLIKERAPLYKKEGITAAVLAFAGSIAIVLEGSITKSPCTISYCFITAAIGIYLLILSDWVVNKIGGSYLVRLFAGAGSNPLMSYIAFSSFVMPLFKLTGFLYIYQAAYPQGYPWVGVLRAAIAVLFTMALVARMSEKRIFWRA